MGYAGGTKENPSYREMGDHTEVLQVEFNPHVIRFEDILDVFFGNHNPSRLGIKPRQYMSILLYHTEVQRVKILEKKSEWEQTLTGVIQTEISPFKAFYQAEDYHQKYYLKRYKSATEALNIHFPSHEEFMQSTLVARLNGFVKGYGTLEGIRREIQEWGLDESEQETLWKLVKSLKW